MSDVPWGLPPFDTFEELIEWVMQKRAQGRTRKEILKFLTDYLVSARERGDTETEDMLLDLFDGLSHWCPPHKRID